MWTQYFILAWKPDLQIFTDDDGANSIGIIIVGKVFFSFSQLPITLNF